MKDRVLAIAGEWFLAALMGVVILLLAWWTIQTFKRPARDADGR